MTSRWTAAAVILLVAIALGGCGSSEESGAGDATEGAASSVPSDLEQATSGDQDLDGESDEGAALTAQEFCGFLAQETPEVVDLQPAEYAAATFGSAVLELYTAKGLLTDIDGADMDALAAEGCPDRASTLLPALGATSFEDLLSR